MSDITSGSLYRKLKADVIRNDYDLCLLWNADGLPISNSSKGNVWLVRVQIVNVHPNYRGRFRYVTSIHYSRNKKPNMMSYLRPFVEILKELNVEGITWFDKHNNIYRKSLVIAPIATLDAPARAATQNIHQYNGAYGCTFSENPGITCFTGLGHNRAYQYLNSPLRTKENTISHASK